jgi:hypothetical protein
MVLNDNATLYVQCKNAMEREKERDFNPWALTEFICELVNRVSLDL